MLTLNKLRALKTELNEMITIIDDTLKPITNKPKLFETQADYYYSLSTQNKVPQDYYKFRYFDKDYYLFYDLRLKKYFLCSDSFNLKEDLGSDFDEARKTFCRYVFEFLLQRRQDELFSTF